MTEKGRLISRDLAMSIKRRFWQLMGLCLVMIGVTIGLALFSFHPQDPSLNAVGGKDIHNLLGWQGAYFADLMYQSFGLASYAMAFVVVAWGVKLVHSFYLQHIWLHFLTMLCAMIFGCIVTTQLPTLNQWAYNVSSGGFWGDFIFYHLTSLSASQLPMIDKTYQYYAIMTLFSVMTLTTALYAGYISPRRLVLFMGKLSYRLTQYCIIYISAYSRKSVKHIARKRKLPSLNINKANLNLSSASLASEQIQDNIAPESALDNHEEDYADESLINDDALSEQPFDRQKLSPLVMKKPHHDDQSSTKQTKLDFDKPNNAQYMHPSLSLLEQLGHHRIRVESVNHEALEQNARMLESVLSDYGVRGEIIKVRPGPVVTLYELEPAPGVKTSRVIGLADDIARSMSAVSVRIATVPGRSVIGIEMPNINREMVHLHALLSSKEYDDKQLKLPLILGKDIGGVPIIADLATMPHLLIAGTTGSGKSVGLNAMILSLLYRHTPEQCKFIMIDPKMLELSVYDDIPHLLSPVVTDPNKAVVSLKWTVREMEERYRLMAKLSVRNIDGYNKRAQEAIDKGEMITRSVQTGFDPDTGQPIMETEEITPSVLPYIVVVVDEMADLMLVAGKEIEASIQRLAQMARAAGIHIIMATQRPSVDVITGTIKANFPTRISFMVTSKIDSRTILGEQGAEQLLGRGDMLYMGTGGRITRVHGPFCEDSEVESVCNHLRAQQSPQYIDSVTNENEFASEMPAMAIDGANSDDGETSLYDQAVALVLRENKASTSFIQRHLQIGYNRAANIIEQMEKEGVVSAANHVGKREILVNNDAA